MFSTYFTIELPWQVKAELWEVLMEASAKDVVSSVDISVEGLVAVDASTIAILRPFGLNKTLAAAMAEHRGSELVSGKQVTAVKSHERVDEAAL